MPTQSLWDRALPANHPAADRAWPRVRGYEVMSVIGSGGMGIVFKAWHRDLRRTVALKTIRAVGPSQMTVRERFAVEAEAVARLQHPNIIQIFEIGTLEPLPGELLPTPFIALEFVEGGSLSQRAEKPQPQQYAARMVEKLARAVQAAHQLGIVHRDLKPANVLLTRDGEPKIADFGVAKQINDERDASGRSLTQDGTVIGTPEYMAPEHAAGSPPSPAIDIYALGVILYELLTARVPFQGATPIETLTLAQKQDPVSPRQFQPRISRDLETICLKCLEKDPAQRYPTAGALADDLQRFLDDRPIHARRVSEFERLRRWCQRNPMAGASLGGVVGTFLMAFALVSWSYWRTEAARKNEAWQRQVAQHKGEAERWERYRANIAAAAGAAQVYNVGNARPMLEAAPREYRNWEWRHLHSQLDLAREVLSFGPDKLANGWITPRASHLLLTAFDETVGVLNITDRQWVRSYNHAGETSALLSADGRLLVTSSKDHKLLLNDVETGQVRATLPGHGGPVHSLALSADGRRLVTGGQDRAIRIWDVRTGRPLRALHGPRSLSFGLYLRADGLQAAYTNHDKDPNVHVLDTESGREVATLPGHHSGLQCGYFNHRGNRFLAVEAFPSNQMKLWDVAASRLLGTLRGHANTVAHVVFSQDDTRIASCSRDQTIGLWDGATGQPIAMLKGHLGRVLWAAFSPDGSRLVSASEDHTVRLWDATSGKPLAVLHGHTKEVACVSYLPDARTIVSASKDGTVRFWDARAVENNGVLRGHESFVYGVAFHPDGQLVASASWDGTARIWKANTGQEIARLPHGKNVIVTSAAFHPAGTMLATRARDAVRLWDLASGREAHRWDVPSDHWRDSRVAINHAGDTLASGCAGREVRLWHIPTRSQIAVLRGHTDEVRDVAFSPDGRWLASAADQGDRLIRIWDLATNRPFAALPGHTGGAYAVAFNGDGTLLASGATDGTARLWDTATWKEVAVLKHGANVYGVSFTPDGTRLACACADNSIRFWDVGTHQEVAELRGHSSYVHQVTFSPDGTRLVSASGDKTLRIWDTLSTKERLGGLKWQPER